MILVAYRHEWEQVDFPAAAMHVNRVKNGNASNPAEATPRPVAPLGPDPAQYRSKLGDVALSFVSRSGNGTGALVYD
jgi:hypothetical protein